MPLKWLKNRSTEARQQLAAQVANYKNRTFLEAVTAACAMIAYADGTITADEKQKMAGFMKHSEELRHFDMDEVISSFNKTVERFEFDADIGRTEALKTISRVSDSDEKSRVLVRVACAIGAADGDFDADEQKAAADICRELGLAPADFDL